MMPKPIELSQGGALAIHLGSNVGHCYGGKPQVWVLPKHMDPGYIGAAMHDALADLWKVDRPDRILVSAPVESPEDNTYALLTMGLVMCIQVFGNRRKIPVELVHPHTVHAAIFERADMTARQLKTAVLSLAKRRGLTNADLDAAHALTLYEFATKQRAAA